jgi:hypothetical protein
MDTLQQLGRLHVDRFVNPNLQGWVGLDGIKYRYRLGTGLPGCVCMCGWCDDYVMGWDTYPLFLLFLSSIFYAISSPLLRSTSSHEKHHHRTPPAPRPGRYLSFPLRTLPADSFETGDTAAHSLGRRRPHNHHNFFLSPLSLSLLTSLHAFALVHLQHLSPLNTSRECKVAHCPLPISAGPDRP